MQTDAPPGRRRGWWVHGSALALVGLFGAGFLVRIRCAAFGRCGGPAARLLDLEALGGLPRLVTTAMFVATAVLAWGTARRAAGRHRLWWTAIAAAGAVLALLKLVSAHSVAKADSAVLTLVGSVGLAVAALVLLWVLGRRWGVAATGPVVGALALYAGAAIGLDAVTFLAAAVQTSAGALTHAASTFVEELGEALSALVLVVTVRRRGQSVRQQ
ncbi:hypothetical protein [Geodermatophilus sp. URMC 64]